jgi:ubiquinone/menaquinone biosynthesis C-methylase UbiE
MIIKDKVSNYWDRRSEKYTDSIEGVLDKSLVIEMNMYLDNWMYKQVQKLLNSNRDANVLDVGCGYGRISKKIIDDYPETKVKGLDISKNYVKIYNSNFNPKAKAYNGSAEKLPFKDSSFDVVLIIATLMYVLDDQKQNKVLSEISRVLRRNGRVLLIEPTWISSLYLFLGKLSRFVSNKKISEINSTIFNTKKIQTLLLNNNIYSKSTSGIPIFSLQLPLLYLLSKINIKLLKSILILVSKIDTLFSKITFLSIFISYIGVNQKK